MGGEDLESDDEYLDQKWHKKGDVVDVAIDETLIDSKKRGILAIQEEEQRQSKEESASKKSKANPRKLILETGRKITEEDRSVQAQFMWTCFSHAMKLKGETVDEHSKFTRDLFAESKEIKATKYEKSIATYLKSGELFYFYSLGSKY